VNRLELHKAVDGREVPGTFADVDEIHALVRAVREGSPNAVFSTILPQASGGDRDAWDREVDWISAIARETGLRVTFPFGASNDGSDLWRGKLERLEKENADGARIVPQVGCHKQGLLLGLRTTHIFRGRPTYEAIADLPVAERAARMADPEVKAAILAERPEAHYPRLRDYVLGQTNAVFPSALVPDQEPAPSTSLAAQSAALGRDPEELLYDWTIADDGEPLIHYFLGGYPGDLDASLELLAHPLSVLGLGDGGAHVDLICDCGYPSFVLSYWARDRARGTLPLETAIRILTSEPAALYGMDDRGVVAEGMKADLNVLDVDALNPHPVEIVYDLPAGAKRVIQRADGFVTTIVAGEVVQERGLDTGARPGRVVRSTP
jgi:N-acyl-D-aspartate/D-glutamate deacylase